MTQIRCGLDDPGCLPTGLRRKITGGVARLVPGTEVTRAALYSWPAAAVPPDRAPA
jgi:hypothetical protein